MPSIPAISSIVWPSMAASKRTRRNFSGNSARALSRRACNSLEAARSSAVLVGGWCSGCDQTVSRRSRRFPERKRSSAKRNAIRTSHARNRVRSRKRSNRRYDRLRDRTRFRAWLVRIAFRLALDRLRSGKRRDLRDTVWSQPEHQPPTRTAEDLAASKELQAHLDNALAELPEKLRLVLLLAAMEGHTIEEIAGMLGISTGTVKSRIFYARKQLAEKLRCYANTIRKR